MDKQLDNADTDDVQQAQGAPAEKRGPARRSSGGREDALAVGAIVAVVLLPMLVSQPLHLLTTPPWYDEIVTWTLAHDPDITRAFRAVWGGFESNSPLLMLLCRPLAWLGEGMIVLRLATLAVWVLAMLGIYALCRKVARPPVALSAVLAVAATPVVANSVLETRFYALLLAATAWAAYFSQAVWQTAPTRQIRLQRVGFVVASVVACGIHYFGIIGICLITAAQFSIEARGLWHRETLKARLTPLLLLAAGNKWRLVPALAADRPGAARALRRAIAVEGLVVVAILFATAALTTVTTPPVNL